MLGFNKKRGPTQAFTHAPDCKLVKADPTTEIQWSEITSRHWVAICQCGEEHWYEPYVDRRVRLDPLDPATFRHMPQCEHRDTTDPAFLRAPLKVQEGAGGDHWLVTCGSCETFWQVPYYAAESVG